MAAHDSAWRPAHPTLQPWTSLGVGRSPRTAAAHTSGQGCWYACRREGQRFVGLCWQQGSRGGCDAASNTCTVVWAVQGQGLMVCVCVYRVAEWQRPQQRPPDTQHCGPDVCSHAWPILDLPSPTLTHLQGNKNMQHGFPTFFYTGPTRLLLCSKTGCCKKQSCCARSAECLSTALETGAFLDRSVDLCHLGSSRSSIPTAVDNNG